MNRFEGLVSLILGAALVTGCTAAAASPSPTPKPSPTPADFTIKVLPAEEPVEGRPAIPGEKVVFLIVATSPSDQPVTIAATASGGKIFKVEPAQLEPGVVGEVWMVPDASTEEATVSTTIAATRGAFSHSEKRTTKVMPFEDSRQAEAQPYFEMWTSWLATNHPEFGITATTKWDSSFVLALLIVSHYAYFSDDWEMKVSWHIMVKPDDFTEVYLRHRGTDTTWTHAFRMDSFSGKTAVHEIPPPDYMR